MAKNRLRNWLIVGAVGLGLIPIFVLGLFAYRSMTKTPLHPSTHDVPSVTRSTPPAKWAGAVAQARDTAIAGLVEQNLPGLSVAVGIDGDVIWAEGFGFSDLDDKARVAPDTRFRIGTTSMALTSAAVGVLLERGSLALDDEIQKYVPTYPKKPWPVTLRQLMSHTAGVRNDGGDEGPLFGQSCAKAAEAVPTFADFDLRFEPGTQFKHSSYGWILVSAAIEAASGDPLFKFMRNSVFDPLGMTDTKGEISADPVTNMASSYFPRFAADPKYGPDPMRPINFSCYSGASAILSTPTDLVRFAMAIHRGTLLKPETVTTLQTSQKLPSGIDPLYGLGWDIENVSVGNEVFQTIGHDGHILGGMTSSLMTFRDSGLTIALVSNTSYANTSALGLEIAKAFVLPLQSKKPATSR